QRAGVHNKSSSHSHLSFSLGLEEKTLLSKKEKMKLRKERWLQKIESVKLDKQKQKAEAKRKATPVVGDMQPLMEALPELSDLTADIKGRKPSKRYVSPSNGLCYFPSSCSAALCLAAQSVLQMLLHLPVQNKRALCGEQMFTLPLIQLGLELKTYFDHIKQAFGLEDSLV
ncbi:hypothetical protein CIB84_004794, partial [Bambusicola thoracicus]